MLGVVRAEALAYLKLGLIAPAKGKLRTPRSRRGELGVLFVPGVAANASQFLPMKGALADTASVFDAFEYNWLKDPRATALALARHVERLRSRCSEVLAVGHSLGGVLLRLVLQLDPPVTGISGFVSICAPLHGTHRSRFAPSSGLRSLHPESELMRTLVRDGHRLADSGAQILTVAARKDQFISPGSSAILPGHPHLLLDGHGHASALFSKSVHGAVRDVAERLSRRAR